MAWCGMAEVCEGAPVAVSGWVLTDRHDLGPFVTRMGLFREDHTGAAPSLGCSPRGSRGRRISAVKIFENPSASS